MPYYVCGWGLLPTPSVSIRIPTKDSGFGRRSAAGWGIGGLYVRGPLRTCVRSCTNLKKAGVVLQRKMPTELLKVPVVRRKKALSMTWTIVSEMPSQIVAPRKG